MQKKKYETDQEIIEAIRANDPLAFSALYKAKYLLIKKLIITKGGTAEDVKDVYQEALIAAFKNLRKKEFKLTSSLSTYIYSIANNQWLKEIARRQKRQETSISERENNIPEEQGEDPAILEENKRRSKLVEEVINELKDPCKTMLYNFYFYGMSMEEIADEMGYASAKNARNAKYKCMERLRKRAIKKENNSISVEVSR